MKRPEATTHFRHPPTGRAFTVLEAVIILIVVGLVTALALPRFSNAAETGRAAALREQLRSIRTEILIYQAEHGGVAPGYPQNNVHLQPNSETLLAQLADAANRAGLPLGRIPVNPFTGSSATLLVPANAPFPLAAQGSQGWVYQPSTGTFAANIPGADPEGVEYFDY